MGMLHKSFDPSGFTYETQYSVAAGGFDRTIASGENFSKTSRFNFDANMGVFYKYKDKSKKARPFVGIAAHHLTRPDESFFSGRKRLPIRWVARAGSDLEVEADKLYLRPDLLYMYQGGAQEAYMGMDLRYDLEDRYSLTGSIGYRYRDALTLGIGFKYKRNRIEFSYDINTSTLQPYTMGRGAMELSLILLGKKGEPLFHPKFL
jgi:type IX secretion system PorP/SprF family membrane protein